MYRLIYLIICALVVNALNIPLKSDFKSEIKPKDVVLDPKYRLPTNIIPTSYKIDLETNIHDEDFNFNGNVVINFDVKKETDTIVLHNTSVIIDVKVDNTIITEDQIIYSDLYQTMTITLDPKLPISRDHTIIIKYKGTLSDNLSGFYKSWYMKDDEKVYLATTQFQPTGARHAFPCFDEPDFKATFEISITHGVNYNAISNMEVSSSDIDPDPTKVKTKFETTPKMSTYLVAFIVSDFVSPPNVPKTDATLHKVFTQPSKIAEADFALESGEKILKELEKYLEINYELKKMDQVAVPHFAAGAMENWGLVTYREPYLLYNNNNSLKSQKENIVSIIAHEFAHQFFGNKVTPKWWNFIWLNEGFATLFANIISDKVNVDFKSMESFVTNVVQKALVSDSLQSTRKMNQDATSPDQINKLFDDVAYAKSASVLRMVMNAMTAELFNKGLTEYLSTYKYENVIPTDLATSLDNAMEPPNTLPDGITIKKLLESWADQVGYPILNVTRNYTSNSIQLTQERFILDTIEVVKSKWIIPYTFIIQDEQVVDGTKPDGWINNEIKTEIQIEQKNLTDRWIIFNKKQTGFYRVNYDEENWNALIKQLTTDHIKINNLNRAQLVDDSINIARSGRLSFTFPMKLVEYLKNETDYFPWVPASKGLSFLKSMFIGTSNYEFMKLYIQDLTAASFKTLGITENATPEPYHNFYLRQIIMDLACSSGSSDCQHAAHTKLQEVIKTPSTVLPVDNKKSIMCHGMRPASVEEFKHFFEQYTKSTNADARTELIYYLSCSENKENLKTLLESIIVSAKVDVNATAEAIYVINRVQSNEQVGLESVIQFLDEKHEDIKKAVGGDLIPVFESVSARITNTPMLEQIRGVMVKANIPEDKIKAVLVNSETNVKWLKDNDKGIQDFLQDRYYKEVETKPDSATSIVLSTILISITTIITINNLY